MVLLQLESHLQRYLLGQAPYLVAGDGSYILGDTGLRIKLSSGFEFDLPVLTGQGACEVVGPCLIAFGSEATQTDCLNHDAVAEVELRWPADAESGLGTREELLSCFFYAAGQLQKALYRTDLAERITETIPEDSFTCYDVLPTRTQGSDFRSRLRVYKVKLHCICASSPPTEEEVVP